MKTDNMIFVFGSNLAGIHGSGAAQYARLYRNATQGIGIGRTGQSYAIPTKGMRQDGSKFYIGDTLPINRIKLFIDEFIEYARERPNMHFQVTRIGCGLAGLKDQDIAPMFKPSPDNCYFDNKWFQYLTEGAGDRPQHNYWGTF